MAKYFFTGCIIYFAILQKNRIFAVRKNSNIYH